MDIERSFSFTPHFWPFLNHWKGQKSCLLIRRVFKKPFFYMTSPRGSCFAKIRVSCQTFKIDIERSFSLTPHFWPFLNHWKGQKSCLLIRRVFKKPFFYMTSPRGSCFAKIRVSCQTFKIDIERSFSLTPHFWPFLNHWKGQKSCLLIRRVFKKPFFYMTSPRGSCFAKIRVSCQTFKIDIERSFSLTPHFWPFLNHWKGQKSCLLIRRVFKKPFFYMTSPRGLVLPK